MWEYIGAMGICLAEDAGAAQQMLDARPGGLIRISGPSSFQFLPRAKHSADCQGCGAPLRAYIHHCEYCRRAN